MQQFMAGLAVVLGITVPGQAQTAETPRTVWGAPNLGGLWHTVTFASVLKRLKREGTT